MTEEGKYLPAPANKLQWLRELLDEGEASGEPTPFDMDEFIAAKRARVQQAIPPIHSNQTDVG